MQHDFDFIWEKGSIYTEKYIGICEELLKKYWYWQGKAFYYIIICAAPEKSVTETMKSSLQE